MSNFILPIIVLFIVFYGFKKVDIYDSFVDGAKESFDMIFKLFPNLLGMILGINIFINSPKIITIFIIYCNCFRTIN